ncbi:PepSY domain-containing protein [Pigmentiphaga aceris]|uniref:PepSY domain-containing protein n=1 Tax=Pigmentiphaga aceris TaxID=1940612 RepID=A0A5C0AXC0_9BURK|nr:PepSY-associated TM helix domain-containing protein [Pigmentiphaga aceris]QEI07122.1 PepSY domain-containing protein [Pigmentiphaga aceris]
MSTQETRKTTPKAPGIRQTMSDVHTWTGLLVGWILFAMFLTGTVSFFRDELSQWMRPEVRTTTLVDAATAANRVGDTLQRIAPDSPAWYITFPDARANTAQVTWRGTKGFESGAFDPATGQRLEARETRGAEFFYIFHFQLHYLPVIWGRIIAGICAMFMLIAIVTGVIVHKKIFVDFFTFRWGKGQRSWLDAHNVLSVFGLPFHLMITYTGLITLMALYVPWGIQAQYPTQADRARFNSEFSAFLNPTKPAGEAAPLLPLATFVQAAEQHWKDGQAGRLQVINAGDKTARVVVVRRDSQRISNSPSYQIFDGVTGEVLKTVDGARPAAETRGVLYGLHIGRFADDTLRWLYFLCSLGGTAMVGTGLVMWTVKRRTKLPDPTRPHIGFRLVERLNIASIAGLSIAMAGMLWLNRLLPVGLAQRAEWEINGFFIIWGVTLLHAIARPAKRAWLEQLWAGVALLALLPVFNLIATSRGLINSVRDGDWVFAGVDLMLLALAALLAEIARRTAKHQPRAKPAKRNAVAQPKISTGEPRTNG